MKKKMTKEQVQEIRAKRFDEIAKQYKSPQQAAIAIIQLLEEINYKLYKAALPKDGASDDALGWDKEHKE